jgi:putative ABC transport system ATP-binding protein
MDPNQSNTLIELSRIIKAFKTPAGEFLALNDVSLSIGSGQLVAITGKSGSGKSTLLNIIAGIDKPSTGSVSIKNIRVDKLSENELASWRGKNIGVVFQFFQLLPTLTVLENVMLPMDFCDLYPGKLREERARSLLQLVDIADQAEKLPSALSGGQQQRAAIARALANDPPLIIADEPTGNLDTLTATAIFELFTTLAHTGKTVVVVTHEKDFASCFGQVIELKDGTIANQITNAK